MNQRFKLTQDGNVHIDNSTHSYTDTLANALADVQAAGITIPVPDLQASSGLVAVAGFEVSASKKELILDNGWHYPIPEAAQADYEPYVSCIGQVEQIISAQEARRAAENQSAGNE